MNIYIKLIVAIGIAIVIAILLKRFFKKKVSKLFIVGNGFDLYHGIPSSYLRFRDYLKQNNADVYETLEKYLHLEGDDDWNQLESNIANLDAEELLDEMHIFLGDPGGDWKDSMYYEFQYEVGKVTDALGQKMQEIFLQWILQLDVAHHSNSSKLSLPQDQPYLNFNYTNSLEKIYRIPERNILYIHGKAVDSSSSIVLGHGWEDYEKATAPQEVSYEDFVDGGYASEEDWQYTEAKEDIKSYFKNSYKNASEIIKQNNKFFKRLKEIKEIYGMGHSMSSVDWKYFEAISQNINLKKVKWTMSYYRNEDIENSKKTLLKIGVPLTLVDFRKLEGFFSIQMKLF